MLYQLSYASSPGRLPCTSRAAARQKSSARRLRLAHRRGCCNERGKGKTPAQPGAPRRPSRGPRKIAHSHSRTHAPVWPTAARAVSPGLPSQKRSLPCAAVQEPSPCCSSSCSCSPPRQPCSSGDRPRRHSLRGSCLSPRALSTSTSDRSGPPPTSTGSRSRMTTTTSASSTPPAST